MVRYAPAMTGMAGVVVLIYTGVFIHKLPKICYYARVDGMFRLAIEARPGSHFIAI